MVTFLCGISMVITVISPWVTFRFDEMIAFTNSLQTESSVAVTKGQAFANQALNDIIKERCQTYILDKASELGLRISVTVELTDEYPGVPNRIHIQGPAAPFAKSQLTNYISSSLGIAKENLIWI